MPGPARTTRVADFRDAYIEAVQKVFQISRINRRGWVITGPNHFIHNRHDTGFVYRANPAFDITEAGHVFKAWGLRHTKKLCEGDKEREELREEIHTLNYGQLYDPLSTLLIPASKVPLVVDYENPILTIEFAAGKKLLTVLQGNFAWFDREFIHVGYRPGLGDPVARMVEAVADALLKTAYCGMAKNNFLVFGYETLSDFKNDSKVKDGSLLGQVRRLSFDLVEEYKRFNQTSWRVKNGESGISVEEFVAEVEKIFSSFASDPRLELLDEVLDHIYGPWSAGVKASERENKLGEVTPNIQTFLTCVFRGAFLLPQLARRLHELNQEGWFQVAQNV